MTFIKLLLKYLFGGFNSIASYALKLLSTALANLGTPTKAKIQAALNIAEQALAILTAAKFLCPAKWQTAYVATIAAVESVISALKDLEITKAELDKVIADFNAAVAAWNGPDDDTCVDCVAD